VVTTAVYIKLNQCFVANSLCKYAKLQNVWLETNVEVKWSFSFAVIQS